MNGITRRPCTTVENLEAEDSCRRLRLTLHDRDRPVRTAEQHGARAWDRAANVSRPQQPIGRAVALVQRHSQLQPLNPEPIKPTEENVEVIKVFLRGSKHKESRQQDIKMLSDEVSQIQEVRYCLKTLREQMAARNNGSNGNNNNKVEHKFLANGFRVPSPSSQPDGPSHDREEAAPKEQDWEEENDSARLREVSRRLFFRLQEAEQRHQAETERLQDECGQYQQQLSEQTDNLRLAQQRARTQDERVRELQRLLQGMEQESAALQAKMDERESELKKLHALRDVGTDQRVELLEKEQAVLKEKIHHLDDMLKSQQRKVRQMIEQLQNSRTDIEERDRVIQDLQEKVAYLEAENRELRDQMDFHLEGQNPSSLSSPDHRGQIVYSKPLTPNGHGNKSLPFIKVIEIKS